MLKIALMSTTTSMIYHVFIFINLICPGVKAEIANIYKFQVCPLKSQILYIYVLEFKFVDKGLINIFG